MPSDKVPRSKSQSDVAAPAPEDPRLAVSVAYAFGSNGSAAAQIEDESAIRDTIRNPPVDPDEDGAFREERTIELDSVDEVIEDDELEDMTEAMAERPTPPEQDSQPVERPEEPDEAEPVEPPELPEPPSQAASAEPPAVPGDSVDIAFDEDEASEAETSPRAESPAPEPAKREASGARFIRAQTMALSDHDLEELMEGEVVDADAALGFEPRETVRMEPIEPEPEPEPEAGDDSTEIEPAEEPEPVGAKTEKVKTEIPPADASDSGEIIADDMLEELDEVARPVELEPEVDDEEPEEADSKTPPPPPPTAKKPKPPPAPVTEAVAKRRKTKGAKPWFEEVFDENYLRTLPFLTPQATEGEADFVVDSLNPEPGASILDVGCGYGRHSMELAARGFNMVGLDLSLPLLLRGADEAQRRGLNINFVHGDMREMSFETPFDGAFCLFETFGYFDDETNKQTAVQIAKALKPGGRLVLEVLNRDYLIADLPTRVWWEGDGCVILEEVDFNYFSSRIISHRSIAFEDGRQLEQEISIRAFALHELGKLLHAAGFRVVEISGSMFTRGRFFGAQSRDIVVVAEKRAKGSSV